MDSEIKSPFLDEEKPLSDWQRWQLYATKTPDKLFYIATSIIVSCVLLTLILLMLLYVPFKQ